MALRSGYKGIKKLAAGLKWNRPGILIVDDTALAEVFFPRSEQAVLAAKNQNFTTYKSETKNGVAWTANADNSVSISGRTSASETEITTTSFEAPFTGQVKFCGGISNECHIYPWSVSDNARPYTDSTKTARQTGTSKAIDDTLPIYIEKGKRYSLILRIIGNNLDVSGTFYPLLVLYSETDLSYVAPAMTNKQLTDKKLETKYINSAIDLDTITETGMYLVLNTSTINRPANTPNMFTLFVMNFGGDDNAFKQQMVIETTGTLERIYTRRYGGSPASWSSWYKIEGTVVS